MLGAENAIAFQSPYPEQILVPTKTEALNKIGGYKWAPGWASRDTFVELYHNGTNIRFKSNIKAAVRNYKQSIDLWFPRSGSNWVNGVFYKKVDQAGVQATMFMDTMEPLAHILETTRMQGKEAWERVAFYPRCLFDAIRLVRVTAPNGMVGSAMLWGSFQTTRRVEEFATHHFTEHPKIASLLSTTLMKNEGQLLMKLTDEMKRNTGIREA